jgi:hypothetical protein
MKKSSHWVFVLSIFILVSAVTFQALAGQGRVVYSVRSLKDFLPKSDGKLKIKDLPLGGTESLDAEVEKTLAYDDYVYRSYEYNGRILNVLVFYWTPGKMQPRLVASHTPDACWVRAGMINLKANTFEELKCRDIKFSPSQGRVFKSNTEVVSVSYWHLVGGEPFGYGVSYQPPWYAIFTDILKHGLKMKSDQLYVRIHSTDDINEILEDDAFYPVFERLSELGLARTK